MATVSYILTAANNNYSFELTDLSSGMLWIDQVATPDPHTVPRLAVPSTVLAGNDYNAGSQFLAQITAASCASGALLVGNASGRWSLQTTSGATVGQVLGITSLSPNPTLGWVTASSGGSGTVTSIAVSSTDSSVVITGSPITTNGTINLSVPNWSTILPTQDVVFFTHGASDVGYISFTSQISSYIPPFADTLTYINLTSTYLNTNVPSQTPVFFPNGTTITRGRAVLGTYQDVNYGSAGTILIGNANGTYTALVIGSNNQVLTSNSGAVGWATPSTSGGTVTSVALSSVDGTAIINSGSPITTNGTIDLSVPNWSTVFATSAPSLANNNMSQLKNLGFNSQSTASIATQNIPAASMMYITLPGIYTNTHVPSQTPVFFPSAVSAGAALTGAGRAILGAYEDANYATVGTIFYCASNTVNPGTYTALPIGTANQVLTVDATSLLPVWDTPSGGSGTVTSVGISTATNTTTVTGSPITTSGNITVDVNWTGLNANYLKSNQFMGQQTVSTGTTTQQVNSTQVTVNCMIMLTIDVPNGTTLNSGDFSLTARVEQKNNGTNFFVVFNQPTVTSGLLLNWIIYPQ